MLPIYHGSIVIVVVTCGISKSKPGKLNEGSSGKLGSAGNAIPMLGGNGISGSTSMGRVIVKPRSGSSGNVGRVGKTIPMLGGNGMLGSPSVGSVITKPRLGNSGSSGRVGKTIPISGGKGIVGKPGMDCRNSCSKRTFLLVKVLTVATSVGIIQC